MKTICLETISSSTFMTKTIDNSKLDRVSVTLKGVSNFEFCIETLFSPFICLTISLSVFKLSVYQFVQNNYEHFKRFTTGRLRL